MSKKAKAKAKTSYAIYFDYTGAGRMPEPIAGPFTSNKKAVKYAKEMEYDLKNDDYFIDEYNG